VSQDHEKRQRHNDGIPGSGHVQIAVRVAGDVREGDAPEAVVEARPPGGVARRMEHHFEDVAGVAGVLALKPL
jgi:hypothetical protein